MFKFEFLQSIDSYIKTFKNFTFPVVLCDTEFHVYWSNSIAKSSSYYDVLTQTEKLHILLSEYKLADFSKRIYEEEGVTTTGVIPFGNLRLNFTPIIHNDSYIGIIIILTQPEDLPSLKKINQVSLSSSVFSTNTRAAISDIFTTMDSLAAKSELLEADWIKPHLSSIAIDCYRILRMSGNVTKYTRFRNHEANLELTSYNIYGWLRKIKDSIIVIGKDMGIPVTFVIPEKNHYISLDSRKFESAFFNIIHNAFFYTKENNEIIISAEEGNEQDYVKITVSDKGLGMGEDTLLHAFEPYYSQSLGGVAPNLGLGLTIAHLVFTAHKGTIEISSTLGEGTSVEMTLPNPRFSDTLHLAQGDQVYSLQDRFSPMYTGVASAKASPYQTSADNF